MNIQTCQTVHTWSGQAEHMAIQAGQTVNSVRSSSTHGHSGRSDSTHVEGQKVHTHEYSGRSDSTHAQVKQYWVHMNIQTGQTVHTWSGQAEQMAIQAGQTVHSARSSSTHGHSARSDSTHAEGQTVQHKNIQAGQTVHTLRSSSTHQCQHYQGIFDSIQYHSR